MIAALRKALPTEAQTEWEAGGDEDQNNCLAEKNPVIKDAKAALGGPRLWKSPQTFKYRCDITRTGPV